MSTRIISQRKDPYETLERLLNKTTLTTQRVTHGNIIDVGEQVLCRTRVDTGAERDKAVAEVLRVASVRHEQHLKATVERTRLEAEVEKQEALDALQLEHEREAEAVALQRQKEEDEKIAKLQMEWETQLQSELELQRLKMERKRELAVDEAKSQLEAALRKEFALTKELEIAAVLANAREKFKVRERQTITRVRSECEAVAAAERERMELVHTQQTNQLQEQLRATEEKYSNEAERRQTVERDFMDLQDDYRRFLDNTHGKFHSDYMMRLRFYGSQDSNLPTVDTVETKLPPTTAPVSSLRTKLPPTAAPVKHQPRSKLLPFRRHFTNCM